METGLRSELLEAQEATRALQANREEVRSINKYRKGSIYVYIRICMDTYMYGCVCRYIHIYTYICISWDASSRGDSGGGAKYIETQR